MRSFIITLPCLFFIFLSCRSNSTNAQIETEIAGNEHEIVEKQTTPPTVVSEINVPEGFKRIDASGNSFGAFLRSFKLNNEDDIVHLYNGSPKYNQNVHYAILDIDVGKRDLQQCADAVMRLQAEYLFEEKKNDDITFLFTNGDWVDWNKYAKGYRPSINGNQITWAKISAEDFSYKNFRKYMDLVFSYAGTYSLSKQLEKVSDFDDLQQGDVLIQGGFPGHAVIIMDVAVSGSTGEKVFMLAQSYMPAQEIHILKNLENKKLSPWFAIPDHEMIKTPEWTFLKENLKRFNIN